MDSVYETLLNRLLEEVKNEDIKKGINIALSAYMDSAMKNLIRSLTVLKKHGTPLKRMLVMKQK